MSPDLCPHECVLCSARVRKAARPASQRSEKRRVRLVLHASAQKLGERVCGSVPTLSSDSAKPACSDSLGFGEAAGKAGFEGWRGKPSRPVAQPKTRRVRLEWGASEFGLFLWRSRRAGTSIVTGTETARARELLGFLKLLGYWAASLIDTAVLVAGSGEHGFEQSGLGCGASGEVVRIEVVYGDWLVVVRVFRRQEEQDWWRR